MEITIEKIQKESKELKIKDISELTGLDLVKAVESKARKLS